MKPENSYCFSGRNSSGTSPSMPFPITQNNQSSIQFYRALPYLLFLVNLPPVSNNNQSSIPSYRTPTPSPTVLLPKPTVPLPYLVSLVILRRRVREDGDHRRIARLVCQLFNYKICKKSNLEIWSQCQLTAHPKSSCLKWHTIFDHVPSATLTMRFSCPLADPMMQLHISSFTELSKSARTFPFNEVLAVQQTKK